MKKSVVWSMLFLFVVPYGCKREAATVEPVLTPATARSPESERMLLAIAKARCDHEVTCTAAGEEKAFRDRRACMDAMLGDGHAELSRCRQRLDLDRVGRCVASIEDLECEKESAGLGSIRACSAVDLCSNDYSAGLPRKPSATAP
jgi:hypothetical protein